MNDNPTFGISQIPAADLFDDLQDFFGAVVLRISVRVKARAIEQLKEVSRANIMSDFVHLKLLKMSDE